MSSKNPETNMSGVAATVHSNQSAENPWASHPEYLDTARLRNITYGNLVLRKSYHKFMAHGILIALALFLALWLGYLSYGLIYEWITGLVDEGENSAKNNRVITSITELAPPPPLNETPPPVAVAPAAPPDVGVVKKVKDEEAPMEKTLANQKDIKKALTAGAQDNKGDTTGIGEGIVYVPPPREPVQVEEDPPMFVAVEKMPAFVNQVKPQYPEIARKAGMEGQVTISVLIGSDGKPLKSKILKRKPEDTQIFDQAATNAVMESTYQPGVQNGRPVKVWLTVPIRFKLN